MEDKKILEGKKVFINPEFLQIPYQVYSNKNLNHLDSFVYAVIYWFYSLKNGQCTASNATIARVLNLPNYRSVQNSLTQLEKNGYIKREYRDKGKKIRKQIIPLIRYTRVSSVDDKVSPTDDRRVSPTDDQKKNTLNKNSNVSNAVGVADKDIADLIDIFKNNNPSYKKLFGVPPQRKAAAELITQFGIDKAIKMAQYAVAVSGQQYAPIIITPYELQKNLGRLIAYYKKENSKVGKNVAVIL